MQTIGLKGHVGPNRKLEITENAAELPEGDVEVLLLYPHDQPKGKRKIPSPLTWPTLNGGRYLGKFLRRKDLYGDDGR